MRFIISFLLFVWPLLASENKRPPTESEILKKETKKRRPNVIYTYQNRPHSKVETWKHIGIMYGVSLAAYPLTQPTVVREEGSFKKYRDNFGDLVFDRDEPFWNWIVHPISGSQLFLYYRANGYTRIDSLGLTFISSALFEFTIEAYTEPASIQDLYQTPVIGSLLGVGIENLSLYLLNTGNLMGRVFGHILNPSTLFPFFEGRLNVSPYYDGKDTQGIKATYEF